MKKIKLSILVVTFFLGTISSASEVKIDFLDGCILKITHPGGERFIDLSKIDYIKTKKGIVTIPDRNFMKPLDNENKKIVLKEWLHCKATVNK